MKIFTTLEVLVVWLSNGKMAKGKTTLDKLAYILVENGDLEKIVDELTELIELI